MKYKDHIQMLLGVLSFIFGNALIWVDFFLSSNNIHERSLWYFGECLAFTGMVFGVVGYINGKFGDMERKIGINEKN